MMKMSQADALLYAYATSVQFTSKNLAICILLLFGHGKDWIVATLFGTLINCYNYYCYRSYTTWRVNGTFCIFTCHSSISQSIVFWGTALMAGEEERDYKPCSPTKNMECAPIWCSPFAAYATVFETWANNSCMLLSLLSFDLSAGEYFEILTRKHLDLNQVLWFNGCEIISFNVPMKKLTWTRNDCEHFWLCIKILLLEIARLIPGHTCKDMDPLQPFIFFWYVLGCSLPLQISFMPVKTSQINNW